MPWLATAASLAGCVAYPKLYAAKRSGTVRVEEGQPVTIRSAVVRSCATMNGEYDDVVSSKDVQPDAKGRYSVRVWALAWNWRNLVTKARCQSRVQLFVCRPGCRMADEVDIEVLGR